MAEKEIILEKLAILMEQLYQLGVDKETIKKAVDIWWKIKAKDETN